MGIATKIGVDRQEKSECLKWQDEATKYPDYYLTAWQKEQCDHWGIQIDTKVLE
jgi:hypothetical protein